MKTIYKLLFVLILMVGGSYQAQAAAKASLMAGVNFSNITSTVNIAGSSFSGSTSASLSFGGGLLVEFPMGSTGLELGALYTIRKYSVSILGTEVESDFAYIEIPVLWRIYLGGAASLGLGGYYGLSMDDGVEGDYGIAGSLNFMLGSQARIDLRYLHGLADVDNIELLETTWSSIQILLGIVF